jgi:transposase-like protein
MTKKEDHRKVYAREFKLQALEMAETCGKSIAQIEDELGLAPGMIYRWKRQFKEVGKEAFQQKGKLADSEEELKRLRRESEQLKEEREILKKR